MKTGNLIWAVVLMLAVWGCNPARHEMPVTTTSEEARKLYLEARDLAENYNTGEGTVLLYQALKLDPEFALAYVWLNDQSGVTQAMSLLGNVSQGEAVMIKAYDAFIRGDYLLCEIMIDSLVELYPKDKHTLFYAGRLWFNQDHQKAIYYFNEAIKLDRYFAAAYGSIGYQQRELGNFEQAEEALVRYLELRPGSALAHEGYGTLLVKMGQENVALKQYRKAILIDPFYPFPYLSIIWIYIRLGNYEQASKYCDLLYELDPTRIYAKVDNKKLAFSLRATIQYVQDDIAGSLEIIDQMIHTFQEEGNLPNVFEGLHYKAWCEMESGLFDPAYYTLTQSMEWVQEAKLDQQTEMSRMFWVQGDLSVLYGKMGEMKLAEEYLSKARSIFNTQNKTASDRNFMNLFEGIFALHQGDSELAISHLQLSADRTSVSCQYYLAEAYKKAGKIEQAVKYYELASNSTNFSFAGFFYNKSKIKLAELGRN